MSQPFNYVMLSKILLEIDFGLRKAQILLIPLCVGPSLVCAFTQRMNNLLCTKNKINSTDRKIHLLFH